MRNEYKKWKKDQQICLQIRDTEVSYTVPDIGVPEGTWSKDGWELDPVAVPPRVRILPVQLVAIIIKYAFLFS